MINSVSNSTDNNIAARGKHLKHQFHFNG